ncbi:Symplekin [Trichoplax sp. H2]|nr:Symplekin [Trichoplax sp. H2]|eukprot:RDD44839.1 Symplekin [Trichoplax sp. H2]
MAAVVGEDNKRKNTAEMSSMDAKEDENSISDRVIELMNRAQLETDAKEKLVYLKQIQELVIMKDSALLDSFLDEMLAFQHEKSADVQKFILGFLEEACKKDEFLCSKVVYPLAYLLYDQDNVQVTKRAIQCNLNLYRIAFKFIATKKATSDDLLHIWEQFCDMKTYIISLTQHENTGVRTSALKYCEMIVLTQSIKGGITTSTKPDDISLDMLSTTHPIMDFSKLKDEAKSILTFLTDLTLSHKINHTNLLPCVGSLAIIARMRPMHFGIIIACLESLNANLPPTLSKSQVSNLRKHLKIQFMTLLKNPVSIEYQSVLAAILSDLGVTANEISRNLPKIHATESLKRSSITDLDSERPPKKLRIGENRTSDAKITDIKIESGSIEINRTAEEIIQKLNSNETVVNLVFASIHRLPNRMPSIFQDCHTPIVSAGSKIQIAHLARLLATQMLSTDNSNIESSESDMMPTLRDVKSEYPRSIKIAGLKEKHSESTRSRKIKQFSLSSLVNYNMDIGEKQALSLSAFERMLKGEENAHHAGMALERIQVLVGLATQLRGEVANAFRNYIFEDIRGRFELACTWLTKEYLLSLAASSQSTEIKNDNDGYSQCLAEILKELTDKLDKEDKLFTHFCLEIPRFTSVAYKAIEDYSKNEGSSKLGLSTMYELILRRPVTKAPLMQKLLDLTVFENEQRRALENLEMVLQIGDNQSNQWSEDSIKMHMSLFMSLLPKNHVIIHNLANMYGKATSNVKRVILRQIEHPIRNIGMSSPELLKFFEQVPSGTETLLTRILYIFTDKSMPSQELIRKVREAYYGKKLDVRALIPIINGLEKSEVIGALPKLMKQSAKVVKEVITRLINPFSDVEESVGPRQTSPLTPSELLLALHQIEDDVKSAIKAIGFCLSEKSTFTQEVLAGVLQQMLERTTIPILFMRTVIQTLQSYPKLISFVMNVLSRLITKQITTPQSYPVLLQLPAHQLESVFQIAPSLQQNLRQHINLLTLNQRAHIPQSLLFTIENYVVENGKESHDNKET